MNTNINKSADAFSELDKKKLVKLLAKEGIEASTSQPKSELIRLLMLAKKANAPTRTVRVQQHFMNKRRRYMLFGVATFVLLSVIVIYVFNPIFNSNVNFLVNKLIGREQQTTNTSGPVIYEKGGKTYVVYDYPLVRAKVLTDSKCKRPECNLDEFYDQIKTSITNLVSFEEVDYNSRQGKNLMEEYSLNLLPVFIFDQHIEKTENFENSKKFLNKIKEKYILQVTPFKALKGPNLASGQPIIKGTEQLATIIEYNSFSCKQCADVVAAMSALGELHGKYLTVVVKYLNTGANDMEASVAAECAAQQDKFYDYYKLLFEKQDEWIDLPKAQLASKFTTMATSLDMSRPVFSACFNEDENVKQLVNSHFSEAATLGITGAPSFFVNNNIISGVYPAGEFVKLVEDILKTEKIEFPKSETHKE